MSFALEADPDAAHRAYMRKALARAAQHLDVKPSGDVVFGWRDRSIGGRVVGSAGVYWLRVVAEMAQWAAGDWWEGNAAANAIQGVAKPSVLKVYEWRDGEMCLRAELMTLVRSALCSATSDLRAAPELPAAWWDQLRTSLDAVAGWPTERVHTEQSQVTRRLLAFYGDEIDATVTHWTTAHGDLHWSNLTAPKLAVLDWEGWGRAPAGLDAATLYCHSLLVPDVAEQVHDAFAEVLDPPDGLRAQLYAIARLLKRVEAGDHVELAGPLHRLVRSIRPRLVNGS